MENITYQYLIDLIKNKKYSEVKEIFDNIPTIDLADLINKVDLEDKDIKLITILFKILDTDISAEFFSLLDSSYQEEIISSLSDEEIKKLIEESSNDELADFIPQFPANIVTKIFKNTPKEKRDEINKLLGYKDDEAGAIMTSEFLTLKSTYTVKQALNIIRETGRNAETIYTLFIQSDKHDLEGVLELDDLVFASLEEKLSDIISTTFLTVNVNDDIEEVANIFRRYDLNAIAVLNKDNKLTGIITIDDIVDIIEKERGEDIQAMNNITPLETPYTKTSSLKLAFKCIPWLIVLIALNVGSMALQNNYQWLIQLLSVISVFLTVVSGCAGNSGTQSSTLIIRGLSTNDFTLKDYFKIVWKEIKVGLITAFFTALFTFLWVLFMFAVDIVSIPETNDINLVNDISTWTMLSSIVALTLFITIIISKILGASFPFLLTKLKLDPAVISGPAITTIMDVVSLGIYFGMISLFLNLILGI